MIGHTVEVDGCYLGGHVRPENERKDRRRSENRTGKRRVVVTLRERGGRTLASTFPSEAVSVAFIKARVDAATTIRLGWDTLRLQAGHAKPQNGVDVNQFSSLQGGLPFQSGNHSRTFRALPL